MEPGLCLLFSVSFFFPEVTFEPLNLITQQGLKPHGQLSFEKCENWQMSRGTGLRLVPAPWKMQGEGGLLRCCLVATTCQLGINQSSAAFSEMSGV